MIRERIDVLGTALSDQEMTLILYKQIIDTMRETMSIKDQTIAALKQTIAIMEGSASHERQGPTD